VVAEALPVPAVCVLVVPPGLLLRRAVLQVPQADLAEKAAPGMLVEPVVRAVREETVAVPLFFLPGACFVLRRPQC